MSPAEPLLLVLALTSVPVPAHDGIHLPPFFDAAPLQGTFPFPTDLEFAPDGSLYIAEKGGRVWFHDGTFKQNKPVLDLRDEVNNNGDRGLLGLALHPGFAPDGGPSSWVYLIYTVSPVPGQELGYDENGQYSFARVSRYRVQLTGGEVLAELGSRQVLLGNQLPHGTVPDAIPSVHNSHTNGSLEFGTDGSLLVASGDSAHWDLVDLGGNDPEAFGDFVHPTTGLHGPLPIVQNSGAFRAQDLRSLGGKVLRIDPETGDGYPSNPFFDGNPESNASRVWALGLRNPFRVALRPGTGSADPAAGDPGVLYVGDVGHVDWEEIDVVRGGENFRWPCYEGFEPSFVFLGHSHGANPLGLPDCQAPNPGPLTDPLVTYNHFDAGLLFPSGVHLDAQGTPQGGFAGGCLIGGVHYPGGEYPPEYDGRYFFADYNVGWIKTLETDGQDQVVALRDFADEAGAITGFAAHPLTGDIHYLSFEDPGAGVVMRLAYGLNQAPAADIQATPTFGDAPLFVSFDGSGSSDPEGLPLSYSWDFGDGSPTSSAVQPQHTYTLAGAHTVVLTVTDSGGLTAIAEQLIAVGNTPPTAQILAPLQGELFQAPTSIAVSGTGSDVQDPMVSLEWIVDLIHDDHVHPSSSVIPGAQGSFSVDLHGGSGELVYYRIQLTATDSGGLQGTDVVYVYPVENLLDVTGTAPPITRMMELNPPLPTGGGNKDPEVFRDAVLPPVGGFQQDRQYDTFHGGDQGDDDWVGFELPAPPAPEFRFVGLDFQEGLHFFGGGWWEDFHVEVRDQGVWTSATGLRVSPAYPFALAATPSFDGTSYESYELRFDPLHGDAIRLRGNPGGAAGFISCGELRALAIDGLPPAAPYTDLSEEGQIVARLFELSPPLPQGKGNLDRETIRNGTWPPPGSESYWGQYDTFHGGDQGDDDWIGYTFGETHTFSRVVFQEGRHATAGGWFETLAVEVQAAPGAPWVPVAGLQSSIQVPGDTSNAGGYETFELDFTPTAGRGIRLRGVPGGNVGYVSVGELRVYEPLLAPGCGWSAYGEGLGGANELTLGSTTPPGLGLPVVLEASGAGGAVPGGMALSAGQAALPLFGGTVLVDLATATQFKLSFDAAGEADLSLVLPADPGLAGAPANFQAWAVAPDLPGLVRFSNGLTPGLCFP